MQVSQSIRGKNFQFTYSKQSFLENSHLAKSIEELSAEIWEDVAEKHVAEMLLAMESLRYVPRKIRMKMATEPLFICRYE